MTGQESGHVTTDLASPSVVNGMSSPVTGNGVQSNEVEKTAASVPVSPTSNKNAAVHRSPSLVCAPVIDISIWEKMHNHSVSKNLSSNH